MKKYSLIALVVLLAALVAGCSTPAATTEAQQSEAPQNEAAQQDVVEVAYVQMNLTGAYYLEMQKGFEEAKNRLAVKLDVLSEVVSKQVEHIEIHRARST